MVLLSPCRAGSIWAKKTPQQTSLYADDKAVRIGDVLTIIIAEDHKVDNKVDRDLEKSTSHSLSFNGDDNYVEHIIPNMPNVGISATSGKSMSGKSDYKDERTIEDLVSVVVEDIYPNGNLLVIGTRVREVTGDKQIIQVSGIVRPSDISYANTIPSGRVANFKMIAISDGPTGDYNKPGWFGAILDFLWPF
jgi:flagellar L-ring protein precursor FlgH